MIYRLLPKRWKARRVARTQCEYEVIMRRQHERQRERYRKVFCREMSVDAAIAELRDEWLGRRQSSDSEQSERR